MFAVFWPTMTLKFAAETAVAKVAAATAMVEMKCIFIKTRAG